MDMHSHMNLLTSCDLDVADRFHVSSTESLTTEQLLNRSHCLTEIILSEKTYLSLSSPKVEFSSFASKYVAL